MGKGRELLVKMVNIKKRFGSVKALKGVDFEVYDNEIVALVGDNGAGKSTLVKILCGVYPTTSGEVYFNGKKVRWNSPHESREAGIEMVYQDLGLVNLMSIARNFFLAKEPIKDPLFKLLDMETMNAESLKGIEELVGISLENPGSMVGNLSGGQQKALVIARSVYFKAKLLILDEPTAALSIKEAQKVLDIIKGVREKGIAAVVISHNIYHVYSVADRFIVLSAGNKLWDVEKKYITTNDLTEAIVTDKVPERSRKNR